MAMMDLQTIVIVVLGIAGLWALVELALTLSKTRATLDDISHSMNELVDQTTPVIAKLDGVVDELQPTLKELPALADKVQVLADEATISLDELNNILGDVSTTTHGVAGVGESATRIVGTATSAAVGLVSKVASFGGITIPEGQQLIAKSGEEEETDPDAAAPKHAQSKEGAPSASAAAEKTAAPAPKPQRTTYVTYQPVSTSGTQE